MIKTIALNMAKNLGDILDSEETIEVYAYALQLVLTSVLNLILILLAAFWLKIIPTTLAFLAVFIPFRSFGGGVHLNTIPRCMAVGSFLILGSAYLATETGIQLYWLYILFLLSLLFTLLCIAKWVPAGTEKNPVRDPKIVRMQKRNMLITTAAGTGLVDVFILSGYNDLALAMIAGAIISAVLISPPGFYLMGFIDRILNNFGKGVINS
jgi:accessory gene regulator B